MMEYKGYIGKVEYDDKAGMFHGVIIDPRSVINFEGESVADLRQALGASVDDYLELCSSGGDEPERICSGRFLLQIPPELHRQVQEQAKMAGKSFSCWVREVLEASVS